MQRPRYQPPVSSPAHGGLSVAAAAGIGSAALLLTAAFAKRYSPTPDHPDIQCWYRRLERPGFAPPDLVTVLGWGLAETALAASGYRLLRQPPSPRRHWALALWGLNFATIAGWAKFFFGKGDLDRSLAICAVQAGATLAFMPAAARVDGKAAALALPYAAWLLFSGVLLGEVWRRNRRRQVSA